HLHILSYYSHLEGIDFNLGVIAPFAIVNAKPPGMPRASHDSCVHVASCQRGPHVWTKVINRRKLSALVKQGHHPTIHGKRLTLALRNVANLRHSHEIAHLAAVFLPQFPVCTLIVLLI